MSGKIIQHFKGTVFDSGKPVSEKRGNLIFCVQRMVWALPKASARRLALRFTRGPDIKNVFARGPNIKDVFTKDFVVAGGPDIKDVFAG